MAAGNTSPFQQHQTGVARIVGREEPYEGGVFDALIVNTLSSSGLASDTIDGVVDDVARAVFHHAYQHLSHLLCRLFATDMLIQHHGLDYRSAASIQHLTAEKGFHHAPAIGNTVVESNQLQRSNSSRIAIAEVQEVAVGVELHNAGIGLNYRQVGLHLAKGENLFYTFLQVLASSSIVLPCQLTHSNVRRLGQHPSQIGSIGGVAVAIIDFATSGTKPLYSSGTHTFSCV